VKKIFAGDGCYALLENNQVANWGGTRFAGNMLDLDSIRAVQPGFIVQENGKIIQSQNKYYSDSLFQILQDLKGVKDIRLVQLPSSEGQFLVLFEDSSIAVYGNDTTFSLHLPPSNKKIKEIGTGFDFMMVLFSDGTLYGWGGYYAREENVLPIPNDLTGIVHLETGRTHVVTLKQDGSLISWGQGAFIAYLDPAIKVSKISVFDRNTIIILEDGSFKCSFYDASGDPISSSYFNMSIPSSVSLLDVACGPNYALFLGSDAKVYGLGYYAADPNALAIPQGFDDVIDIKPTDNLLVGLRKNETVVAAGTYNDIPDTLTGIKAIATGYEHLLVLRKNGTVEAYGGRNVDGQNNVPTNLNNVTQIAARENLSFALKQDGSVVGWGSAFYGSSARLPGFTNVVSIAIGEWSDYFVLGLKKDGTVVSWPGDSTPVPGVKNVRTLLAGYGFTGAILGDGSVIYWNHFYIIPKEALFAPISTCWGRGTTFALQLDGSVVHWGDQQLSNLLQFPPNVRGVSSMASSDAITVYSVDNRQPLFTNRIRGKIFEDPLLSCLYDSTHVPIPHRFIVAEPGDYYASSDSLGNFQLNVEAGDKSYSLQAFLNPYEKEYVEGTCLHPDTFRLSGQSKDTCCVEVGSRTNLCSYLTISVGSGRLRRCFRGNATVQYANLGNASANEAEIKVVVPPFVIPLSSQPMWSSRHKDTLIYQLGTLSAGETGQIILQDSIACVGVEYNGLSQCFYAVISPQSDCFVPSNLWDGATISLSGTCDKGIATFQIENKGEAMTSPSQYRIFLNDTLIKSTSFLLTKGMVLPIRVVANGKAVRLEADQSTYHPEHSSPRLTLEGCTSDSLPLSILNMAKGYGISVAQDNWDHSWNINCQPLVSSFDPNEKEAQPTGMGREHFIAPNTPIQYTIRFQNTGTDTAFTVVVEDSLDPFLDVSSFLPRASSHPYSLRLTGSKVPVLSFVFHDIHLADSASHSLESQGYVQFSIRPIGSTPNGYVLQNKANIYFDFNDPIATNTVWHTVEEIHWTNPSEAYLVEELTTIPLGVSNMPSMTQKNSLFPNPTSSETNLNTPELWTLRTSIGEMLQKGEGTKIDLSAYPKGMYLVETPKRVFKVFKQ
jgi:uncharacterized repeat protein (TIGR01451 family)